MRGTIVDAIQRDALEQQRDDALLISIKRQPPHIITRRVELQHGRREAVRQVRGPGARRHVRVEREASSSPVERRPERPVPRVPLGARS